MIALILLVFNIWRVSSHGMLTTPKSRNYLAWESRLEYCPHCLNGGTVGTVKANSINNEWPYPETEQTSVRHGLCGDPAGEPQPFMAGGDLNSGVITGEFQQGEIIPITMTITTHHRGHVEFSICNKASLESQSGRITQTCLDEHKLAVIHDPSNSNSFVDANYPNRYFLPPVCADGDGGVSEWSASAPMYTALVQLPSDLTCEHCVLQWYYVTANSCNPPGYDTIQWPTSFSDCGGDGGGQGWWSSGLSNCEDGGYPEEFWNCADIRIRQTNSAAAVTAAPTAATAVTAAPTATPTGSISTAAPTTATATSVCAGFIPSASCWESGCTVQVQVANWVPKQIVSLHFLDAGAVSLSWNSNIIDVNGQITILEMESWNSDSFGFNMAGSVVMPEFICDGSTIDVTAAPTRPISTAAPSAAATSVPTSAGEVWDLTSNIILYHGQPKIIQGFAVTCLEYLLRGIGSECMAEYDWNDLDNLITSPNQAQVDALLDYLASNSNENMLGSVRFSLNAAYWLDVPTAMWETNRAKYPLLSDQYRTLVDNLVDIFTSQGVVVILDLHWNDDVTEQQAMALRSNVDGDTGDSVEFWTSLAERYGANNLIFYELYNEPFASDYQVWKNGGGMFEGMKPMYDAIRAITSNPIIIAGRANYAYDAESLVQFETEVQPHNIIYNLHPYMGPHQKDDASKDIPGYETRVERILEGTGRPLIITEFGQYCCESNGPCYLYDGMYDGDSMGYVEAVLTVNTKYDVSWTAWAWRPNGAAGGDCLQPDANEGTQLYDSAQHEDLGADWNTIFPKFYGLVTSA